jgi:hypothetical protein
MEHDDGETGLNAIIYRFSPFSEKVHNLVKCVFQSSCSSLSNVVWFVIFLGPEATSSTTAPLLPIRSHDNSIQIPGSNS